MKNYCRYCGYCIDNGYNDYYCTFKEKFLTTETVKYWSCGSFGDCGIDVITGQDRKDRKSVTRIEKVNDGEQLTLSIANSKN